MEQLRLDRLVCEIFKITRKEAKKEISMGNVTVNGQVARKAAEHFTTDDEVCLGGVTGKYQKFVYIMMHKPTGVLSATSDKKAQTVIDILPSHLYQKDLFVAGRLDKDTTGFLLLTNDGDFAHKILSPKNHIPKTYIAELASAVTGDDITAFDAGISLSDFVCKPALLEPLEGNFAKITIVEGKFHQIKRMFAARNNEVIHLHRVKMGNLSLDEKLAQGQARLITEDELNLLKGRDF